MHPFLSEVTRERGLKGLATPSVPHMVDNRLMKFLAIECSTENLSLAASNSLQNWYFDGAGGSLTSSVLVPECLKGMAQLQMQFKDLDVIVYGRGPGSFTGLRTACSVAQGFSYPHQTPTLGLDSLLTLAQTARQQAPALERFFSVLDARMGQLYVGAYELIDEDWRVVQAPSLLNPVDLQIPPSWRDKAHSLPFVLASNTQGSIHTQLLHALDQQKSAFEPLVCSPRAHAMIEIARRQILVATPQRPTNSLKDLPTPMYIRERVAQTTLERSQVKAISQP